MIFFRSDPADDRKQVNDIGHMVYYLSARRGRQTFMSDYHKQLPSYVLPSYLRTS